MPAFPSRPPWELVREIRKVAGSRPITLMGYYNMVLARGTERFISDFARAGIDGLLVPDLPAEQAHEIADPARAHGVETVFIASPLTDARRLELLRGVAGGFLYVVTRLGITGVQSNYSHVLDELFARIHQHIDLPAFAGFGISEPAHAKRMVEAGADGVIVGSRLVQLIEESETRNDWTELATHTRSMITALGGS